VNIRILLAALAVTAGVAGCSQKDPAGEAIEAAANALNAVYEDAQKYVPERYAAVKGQLDAARKAFEEERYADAIAAVRDVPAQAEALAKEAAAEKEKRLAELNADWARIEGTLPDLLTGIDGRLEEFGGMQRLPQGMDRRLLEEANAALASARTTWEEATSAEGMAQDLVARLGMQAA
jgi:DNA-binding FrmR family transcriptional regulator